ncbi:MAG: T9SS type A sorting domain-containing protein, partial [Bacteroidetes bacterium]|nr:T9SS type A sorting domain-containing protein [Bacteroidota bacterium]
VVARYDGTDWTDETQAGGIMFTDAGFVISQTVTSFSPFTFGSRFGLNPLPIELLDFQATLHENWVELIWATASEKNNDFFTLERSQDGLTFEELLEMDGVGDSEEVVNYQASDEVPLPGLSFYRLKQTDFDGTFTYSHLVSVNNLNNFGPDEINIYPQPSLGSNFTINMAGNINQNIQLDIYDINGNKRFSRSYSDVDPKILEGNQLNLESGMYIVRAQGINFVISRKLLIY